MVMKICSENNVKEEFKTLPFSFVPLHKSDAKLNQLFF